jgi:putative hydrolase of the HAD superfamily
MDPRAVLLDLDDTLINFDGVAEPVWRRLCGEIAEGYALGVSPDALWHAIYLAKTDFWSDAGRHLWGRHHNLEAQKRITRTAFEALGLQNAAASDALAEGYATGRQLAVELFPQTLDALAALRARGLTLALVTNGTRHEQRGKIARFGLAPFFAGIFIEEELGFGKPDPRVFPTVLDALKLKAAKVWMVGDNLSWDVGAPQKIGIFSVWQDNRGAGLPPGATVRPDAIIRHPAELLALLP